MTKVEAIVEYFGVPTNETEKLVQEMLVVGLEQPGATWPSSFAFVIAAKLLADNPEALTTLFDYHRELVETMNMDEEDDDDEDDDDDDDD